MDTTKTIGGTDANGFAINVPYTGNANIPVSSIAPTTPLTIATPNYQSTDQLGAMATAYLDSSNQTSQQQVDQANKQFSNESSALASLQKQLGNQAEDTNTQYQVKDPTTGKSVFDLAGELRKLNAQAYNLNIQNQASTLAEQNKATGQNITSQAVQRNTADATRENNIKLATIAMQGALAKADYDTAKELADNIITAKYDKVKAEIEARKTNLESIKLLNLTPAQAKLVKEQEAQIRKEEQDNAKKQATETANNAIYMEVLKNGTATPEQKQSIADAIKNGKSTADILALAGSSLRSGNTEVIKLGDSQAYLIDKTTGKIIKSFGGGSGGSTPGDRTAPLYNSMDSKTATAVRSKVSNFKTEPMVQNFAVIQDGYNFASSLNTKTTNPADDQALIYSLAKALDPGSVVREGEYATAQKYAQSWVKSFGKGVEQAISGTGFLSEDARKNIKKTIEQRYESSRKSYDNLYNQYAEGVNSLTGKSNGKDFLVDYAIQKPGGLPKGTMDDRTYVEKAVTSQQYKYEDIINNTPQGSIPVVNNKTGIIEYLPISEFNQDNYTKL